MWQRVSLDRRGTNINITKRQNSHVTKRDMSELTPMSEVTRAIYQEIRTIRAEVQELKKMAKKNEEEVRKLVVLSGYDVTAAYLQKIDNGNKF